MYSTYDEDSDTDDDEGQKKLARTSNYLFNSNSSGEEDSDSDDSSTNEDEGLELTPECTADSCKDVTINLLIGTVITAMNSSLQLAPLDENQ